MKTAFRLPSRVNEDFIRNLIWQHQQQQQQENINQQQQQQQNINQFTSEGVSKNIHSKRHVLNLFLIKFQVFNLQRYQ